MLKHGSPGLQLRGTDVMLSAIQHDPAPLRQFMRSQKDHELFHLLVRYCCVFQIHFFVLVKVAFPDGRSMCFAVTSAHVVSHVVCGLSPDLWFYACSALFAEPYHDSCLATDVAQAEFALSVAFWHLI